MRLTYCLRRHLSKLELLKSIRHLEKNFGFGASAQKAENSKKTVVVEYSSPNIAKPFHVGHLRSTILGNFIGNLYERFGWNVIRLNYLGDWGTQFGLLLVGYQKYGNEEELNQNPLHHLLEIYVKINNDVATEKQQSGGQSDTYRSGLQAFNKLETGDTELITLWQRFKDISLQEYTKIYKRLGISFTDYHSESMYNEDSINLVNTLRESGILQYDEQGRGVVSYKTNKEEDDSVVLLKSDGSTLYITRDIAAIMDRYEKYKFDKIHYVVENSQHMHFQHLTGVMNQIPEWKNRLNEDIHIKFGRINGLSTRKGNIVFLDDFLREATNRIKQSMQSKQTTKVDHTDFDSVAEELGRSSIIVQDLGQHRLKNYKFTWDRCIYSTKLQYCHARLCSVERNSDVILNDDFEEGHLSNKEAHDLCSHLAEYETILQETLNTLEPYLVVKYIDELCDLVNAAYRTCRVKDTEDSVAQSYLHMFHGSKLILSSGMTLLGLKPLDKM